MGASAPVRPEAATRLRALLDRHGAPAARTAIARDTTTAPELLTFMAGDDAATVRAAVAANPATPPQAGLLLAEDPDPTVRQALASRLGRAAAGTEGARDRRTRITAAILVRLVEDAAAEVRAALADALAGLPDAPRELILRLARDTALPVAEPVLRLSPLLTDDNLIALVEAPPAAFTRNLVAARPRLGEAVAEAIAASTDRPAIGMLLHNGSAAIREATLDQLIEAAAQEPAWQVALARCRVLPPRAARALGAILAAHLLDLLAAHPDLPRGLAAELSRRIAERMEAAAPAQAAALEAARSGDRIALAGVLAAAAGMVPARAEAAIAMCSPRVIAALCWRAAAAETVQAAFSVEPARVVRCNAEGGWTLSPAELQWQVQMLEELPG
jgi:uncharacterized protein (DUF2336 family)